MLLGHVRDVNPSALVSTIAHSGLFRLLHRDRHLDVRSVAVLTLQATIHVVLHEQALSRRVCRKEGNIDWDDTYVCVDITNQYMSFMKDGKAVLSSSIVTGDPTQGHSTPTGAYQVMYKERDVTLEGQGYSSPVSYFIPFTTNVGFHDATWRSSFGGSIYRGNGSHGCVNMPAGNAAALYQIIETGTPVFVYQ